MYATWKADFLCGEIRAINAADFTAPEAGRTIRTLQGYMAFLPAPLPPHLTYDTNLVLELSRADAALSELAGVGRLVPNPHLLISPYMRREAVLSSRIEGTRASLADLLLDEAGAVTDQRHAADILEVRNYVTALEFGIARVGELPLSLRLVRELHGRLMSGVRGEHATPGEFRRTQNWIGPSGSTPSTAPYVPPPPLDMIEALDHWERFLHERGTMPDLIQCALMHEQFEAIHPFLDGNGRVGRLLVTLFLMERRRLSQPLLYLSAYIEAHRQDYYDLLQRVRTHGDWSAWLHFFLAGVAETAQAAMRQASNLMDLRETYRGRLLKIPKALALLDALFVNPYITVARAAQLLHVSSPTARAAVLALQEQRILEETTGGAWRRMYLAAPILHAVESPPPA